MISVLILLAASLTAYDSMSTPTTYVSVWIHVWIHGYGTRRLLPAGITTVVWHSCACRILGRSMNLSYHAHAFTTNTSE